MLKLLLAFRDLLMFIFELISPNEKNRGMRKFRSYRYGVTNIYRSNE